MNKKQIAQGDVLLEEVDYIPDGLKIVQDCAGIILAEGEVTGHAHRVKGHSVLLQAPDGSFYLQPKEPTMLEHTKHGTYVPGVNHKPIELKNVTYRIGRIQEYDHIEESTRRVAD
ncbi:MAG: hypothetical protein PHX80_03820 [Candidatus Nanoarchaeia archaeon]|nr:hypothetical protein [Candidatus Nanoarchaeia archaeon]